MERGYPSNPAFEAALKEARERAAGFNRSSNRTRQQPDPPDNNDRNGSKKNKERTNDNDSAGKKNATAGPAPPAGAPPPHPGQMEAERVAAAAAAERNASMYHLPHGLHGRLGMGGGLGAGGLLHHLQMSELQNRIAFDQQRQSALLAAAGRPPWASGASSHLAEDRWRAAQGLHSAGASAYLAGRGMHPGMPPMVTRGSMSSPHLPPTAPGSEGMPPEMRLGEFERADHTVSAHDDGAESQETNSAPAGGGGGLDLSLLAAAAEDTLRREERVKAAKAGDPDGKNASGDPPVDRDVAASTAKPGKLPRAAKKKRKGAHEPKNPLGAFVFFQRKIMADVFEENPCITFGEAASECGRRWRVLPEEGKEKYRRMAADDKARYTRELATFKTKGEGEIEGAPASPAQKAKVTGVRRKKEDAEGDLKSRPEPRRPKSALLFFKAEEIPKVLKEFPNVTQKEAATEAAARYKTLNKTAKERFEKMAADDKERYQRELNEKEKAERADMPAQRTRSGRVPTETAPAAKKASVEQKPKEENPEDKDINGWKPSAVQVPSQVSYDDMKDPNPYYIEDTAWRYHNPPVPPAPTRAGQPPEEVDVQQFPFVSHDELRPLPPPPPLPSAFPNTPFCHWSYDEDTRVLHADFRRASGDVVVTIEDEKFLLEMFERDDITVVSEGLVSGLNKEKWTLDYISRVAGDEYYHRFRRFDKPSTPSATQAKPKKISKPSKPVAVQEDEDTSEQFADVAHEEVDKMMSMKVKDFVTYLRRRTVALAALKDAATEEEKTALCTFSFPDHAGVEHQIDVTKSALYMLDFDIVKLLPTLYEDFYKSFKLARGILPGGSHCMMNCVTPNGRPFMGPNMYVTPPGSFTHFHQDGHGTVDSGHLCLSGYNEVVMTRRLTERAKRHALRLLTGGSKKGHSFEGLYDLPHADNLGAKPQWPDNDAIEACNKMNYCVSRFILKEGQCVHINKGRLHAFRKVSNEPLPPNDCHAKLRAELKIPGTNEPVVGPGKPEVTCISVAWDWMYRGVTAKGINREVISILECAALNRKYGALSLAIPELCLIKMAKAFAPKLDENPPPFAGSLLGLGFDNSADNGFRINADGYMPPAAVICKGIFPGLQYVVKQHIYAINVAESLKSRSFERNKRVSISARPNAWENPVTHPLDPYGNSDFFCKLCQRELSNVYLHCDGCELLLSKDFNICISCHQEKRYATSVQMHPLNNKRHSTINHIGNFTFDRASRCPCKNGPVCRHCNFCAGCSCRCHSWFTLYFRFMKKDDELKLLHRVKILVGREELEAAAEAEKRLSMAIKGRFSEEAEAGPFGLHKMDVMVDSQFADAEDEEMAEADGAAAIHEESETEDGQTKAAPQPKRKSRRLLNNKVDADVHMQSTDDTEETSDSDAGPNKIDRSRNDAMQVAVEDLKVTIRYKTGEWNEDEVALLKAALEEPKSLDWTSIAATLPERGSEQIHNYAMETFPELVEALKKRCADRNGGDGSSDAEVEHGGEAKGEKESETLEKSDTEQEKTAASENGQEAMDVEVQENSDDVSMKEGAESAGTDRVKVEVEEEESDDQKLQQPERVPVKEEDTDDAVEEEADEVGKLPPANQGRWQDDEKERLKVALETCDDLDAVERYVGTRRMAAIRCYAPRTFPKLYRALKEKLQPTPDAKKEHRRSSGRIARSDSIKSEEAKPDSVESVGDSSPNRRSTRSSLRTSTRRGSRGNSDVDEKAPKESNLGVEDDGNEEKKESDTEPAGERTEDESARDKNDDAAFVPDKSPKPKRAVLQRGRSNSQRLTSPSNRGRRSTQDLSGGRRKRQSIAQKRPSLSDPADSDTSEEEPPPRAISRRKRVKLED